MYKNKRKIELFTSGCSLCEAVIKMVQSLEDCEVTIYNLYEQWNDEECIAKVKAYQIVTIPAIVIDGELLDTKQYLNGSEPEKSPKFEEISN